MGGSTPRVLLCTCQHTLPLDGKGIAAALGGQAPAIHTELCAAEADAVSRALDPEAPLLIGCTQEAPLFEEIAGEAQPHAGLRCVNIREKAGWSDEGRQAQAKIAAGDADPYYANKLMTGRYFVERILPDAGAHLKKLKSGAEVLMQMPAEAF